MKDPDLKLKAGDFTVTANTHLRKIFLWVVIEIDEKI